MIIHLACDLSRVGYRKDQYWVQFCFFFTSMIYAMCQTYLNLYYSPMTQILFCSSTSLHDLRDTINRELGKLFVWFSVNRLSLNLGKTNYMLFRSRPPDNELALTINNVVLPRVAATKFLGIIIDDKLSWKPHIQSVKSIYLVYCQSCTKHLN